MKVLTLINTIIISFLIICDSLADGCYNYTNLTNANRNRNYDTPLHGPSLCDDKLIEGWHRFVGDAGTKMPTTSVLAYKCGTDRPGWLNGAHPTVEDGKVKRKVCFSDLSTDCKGEINIVVKNCGSFYIYYLHKTLNCSWRYCGTN